MSVKNTASRRPNPLGREPRRLRPQLEEGRPPRTRSETMADLRFDWERVRAQLGKRRVTPSDLILLLLDIGKVSGRTMMQKQVFLAYMEVLPENAGVDPGFRPDRFGPYSQVVSDMLLALRVRGFIRVQSRGEGHSTYLLAAGGGKVVREIRSRPGVEQLRGNLAKRKAGWDEWSAHGIMQYVYRNYPEFATATAVPHLKWE